MTQYYLELPTEDLLNYSYTTTLDNREYKLTYRWDITTESWYLTIAKADETVLLAGVRLVPWLDILYRYTKEDLPLGNLYLIPTSYTFPSSPDILLTNLQTDFLFVYNSVN